MGALQVTVEHRHPGR